MKNLTFIFILVLAAVNVALAQKQTNQVEALYKTGVESAGKAGSTTEKKIVELLK